LSTVVQSGTPDALVVQSVSSAVVEVPEGETLVVEQPVPPTVVVTRGVPGLRGATGPKGDPGQSGASYLTYFADGALGGQRVVRATSAGKVGYVDPGDPAQAHAAIGLTMGAAADGASINVQFSGEMSEPSWSWTANQPIFAGANGIPTQTPPATGFQAAIGVAISATAMVIQIKSPIVL
jgi:hypothetical protein